jgi:ferredoxin--NADP+ reductase
VHSGSLSPRLFNLKAGDSVWLAERFKGMFTLSEVPNEFNILLIATGTGVAPYMSMIRTEITQGLQRRFAVVLGANHSVDLGYHEELKALDSISDNFHYLPILSLAHEEPVPWPGHQGFIQDLWQGGTIDKIWGFHPTSDNTHVFLCGNPIMIDIMVDILSEEGFKEHSLKQTGQIHLERFFTKAK